MKIVVEEVFFHGQPYLRRSWVLFGITVYENIVPVVRCV